MKKALSIIAGMSMLLSLVSCSEATKETSSEERVETTEATTTAFTTTDVVIEPSEQANEPISYTISSRNLDRNISVGGRKTSFTIQISSDWSSASDMHYGYEMCRGLFFRINTDQSNDYSSNSEFLDDYISKSPDWMIYTNKNGVDFATITEEIENRIEKERSIYKLYNNGYICTIYFGTKSVDGLSSLDKNSIAAVLDTVILEDDVPTTAQITEPPTTKPNISKGQENALKQAKSYISHSAFSYNELIEQLEYEKYSHDEAVYGADNCGADWNAEALEQATSYISHSAFSYSELYDQLIYGQFTSEQAQYGVDNCGADWNAEAVEQAESYLSHSSFSREELYDQLIYEGFTPEQAEHGVSAVY